MKGKCIDNVQIKNFVLCISYIDIILQSTTMNILIIFIFQVNLL